MRIQSLTLLLPVALFFGMNAQAQPNPAPTQITTTDGRTYNQVQVLDVQPDGLVVQYQPERPGLGMAKIKFRNLPDSVRNQYNYDAQRAADFETQQAQANAQWRSQPAPDQFIRRYRQLAEWNRALAGDALTTYSVSMDKNGNVTTQGFTGNTLPYSPYYDSGVPYYGYGATPMPGAASEELKPGASRGGGY